MTTKLRHQIISVVSLVVFGYLLYLGIVQGVKGAERVVEFYVGLGFVFGLFLLNSEVRTSVKKNWHPILPQVVDVTLDVAITLFMVWYGWFWTPILYIFSVFCYNTLRD